MAVLDRVGGGGWARPAAALAVATAATLALWGLSLLIERPEGWRPPAGADVALYIHLFTVIPAVPLGAFVLWGRKGGRTHRLLGRSGNADYGDGPVHLLAAEPGRRIELHPPFSGLTLVSIPRAVWNARRGNIRAHRNAMRGSMPSSYRGAACPVPGRTLGTLLFG